MELKLMVAIPVHIVSEQNKRDGHWGQRSKRVKAHREAAVWSMSRHRPPFRAYAPIRIHLERIGHSKLDDDNLVAGFKAVRDGVADWLVIDDGDPCLVWSYSQHVSRKLLPHAIVTVTWIES